MVDFEYVVAWAVLKASIDAMDVFEFLWSLIFEVSLL